MDFSRRWVFLYPDYIKAYSGESGLVKGIRHLHKETGQEATYLGINLRFERKCDVRRRWILAIGTYRRSVSEMILEMTRVALLSKRADIVRDTPNFSEKKVLYRLSRTEFFCCLPWAV